VKHKKNLYCISGLGADYRVFHRLEKHFNLKHLHWINPEKNESLTDYAKRLSENIDTNDPIHLIGVSFGGIIAQEIAEIIPVKKLILISSFYSNEYIPSIFKILVGLKLNHLFFPQIICHFSFFNNFSFGVKEKEDKKLLKSIIRDTPRDFFIWATNSLVKWKSHHCQSSFISIHGTKDHVIPFYKNCDLNLVGAGHFGIFTHSQNIIQLLQ